MYFLCNNQFFSTWLAMDDDRTIVLCSPLDLFMQLENAFGLADNLRDHDVAAFGEQLLVCALVFRGGDKVFVSPDKALDKNLDKG